MLSCDFIIYIKYIKPMVSTGYAFESQMTTYLFINEIFQARILEWLAISFSGDLLNPDQTRVSCAAGRFFTN